jgi:hypothetical protein
MKLESNLVEVHCCVPVNNYCLCLKIPAAILVFVPVSQVYSIVTVIDYSVQRLTNKILSQFVMYEMYTKLFLSSKAKKHKLSLFDQSAITN